MSPEVWLNKPYGTPSDVWAVGCLAYELCALRPPFVGNTFAQLKQSVLVGKYPALPRAFSYDMTSMVGRMVRVNARERPSVKQILASEEVTSRKASDWYKEPARAADAPKSQGLAATIAVPRQIQNLQRVLPKPCFPDQRPDSPEVWPLGAAGPSGAAAAPAARHQEPAKAPAAAPAPAPPPKQPTRAPAPLPIRPRGSAADVHGAAPNAPPRYGNQNNYYPRYHAPSKHVKATAQAYGAGGARPPLRKPLGAHGGNRAAGAAGGYQRRRSSGYGQYR